MIMNNVCVQNVGNKLWKCKKIITLWLSKVILKCTNENEKVIFRKLETNIKKLISTEEHQKCNEQCMYICLYSYI